MSYKPLWYCVRQRAGPLIKECRSLRPRLSAGDAPSDRRDKHAVLRSAVCRSRVDRLELRLALLGRSGRHYTLTFDNASLPADFSGVRAALRSFFARARRWRDGVPFDYIYCIEGRHGDHRYHIHLILSGRDFSSQEIRRLWRAGMVHDEPVLREEGGFRRLAEYFNKEGSDGVIIPVGRHPWSCSRSLTQRIQPPERWRDVSGLIPIPDDVIWSRKGSVENDFGAHYYGSYILPEDTG